MVGKLQSFIKKLYLLLAYIFLYAPIIFLIIFSFNEDKNSSKWTGFSLKWYTVLFNDDRILTALYYTLLVAIISAVISTIFGTISAIGIHNMNGWKKKAIINLNSIPILNPDIVTAIAFMTLFIFFKISFGLTTLIIAHIAFGVPYVILSVLPKLRQLDDDIINASLDLGATSFYTLRRVILPQIKPGIFAGFLMAFTMSIDDFVISFFNTGSGITNLSIEIFSMARRGLSPEINALSTLMFITILLLLLLANGKDFILRGKEDEKI